MVNGCYLKGWEAGRSKTAESGNVLIFFFLPKQKHPLPVIYAYWDHKEITISSLILQISQAERVAGRRCSSSKIRNQSSVSGDQLEFKTPACF